MPETQPKYAGYYIRALAYLVDAAVWTVPVGIVFLIVSGMSIDIPSLVKGIISGLTAFFVIMSLRVFFKPYLIFKFGGDIGKLLTGVKVTNENGTNLTFKNALFREFIAKIASNVALGIGYMWVFRNPQKQAWHDMIAGTYVYKKSYMWIVGLLVYIILTIANISMFIVGFYNISTNKGLSSSFSVILDDAGKSNSIPTNPTDTNNTVESLFNNLPQE